MVAQGLAMLVQGFNTLVQVIDMVVQGDNTPVQGLNTPVQVDNMDVQVINTPVILDDMAGLVEGWYWLAFFSPKSKRVRLCQLVQ